MLLCIRLLNFVSSREVSFVVDLVQEILFSQQIVACPHEQDLIANLLGRSGVSGKTWLRATSKFSSCFLHQKQSIWFWWEFPKLFNEFSFILLGILYGSFSSIRVTSPDPVPHILCSLTKIRESRQGLPCRSIKKRYSICKLINFKTNVANFRNCDAP